MANRRRSDRRKGASVRRASLPAVAAILGAFLLLCGFVVAVVDAQLRSTAATAALVITENQREKLEDLDFYEFVLQESSSIRASLIMQNLASGGPMPERAFTVEEMEDGRAELSWNVQYADVQLNSWVGWQLKPVGILPFAGLSVLIAAGFLSARRWESRHPLS